MHVLDALIVAAFAAYAVAAGLSSRRLASRGLRDYFLAGRTLSGWRAGISMAATQFAADTPLLVTGLVATAGVFALWRLWIYAIAFLLLGFVLAPSWRRARVLTDAELTELRYGGRPAAALRAIKAVYFGLIFNCTVLAMVMFAAKEIAQPFLLWNEWLPAWLFEPLRSAVESVGFDFASAATVGDRWTASTNNLISIAAIVAITTLYSTTGGLRSVVQTDLLQFAIMMAATGIYAWVVVRKVGGLGAIPARLEQLCGAGGCAAGMSAGQILAFSPSRATQASGAFMAVVALQWLVQMNADGTGYLAQRSMACRSDQDARTAALVFTVVQILLRSLLWLPIALGLLLLFPPDASTPETLLAANREATYVRGIQALLPVGALGLMLTAMLAALASTVDTHLNWGASYLTNDLYRRFYCSWRKEKPHGRKLVWVARGSNALILLVSLGIMTQLSSIQVAWQMSLLLGAGMGVMLVLRWLWWRITAWGEIAALATSTVLAPTLLTLFPNEHEAIRLLLLSVLATTCGVSASIAGGPEARERLTRFYAKARPPGFWEPIASYLEETPHEPLRRLRASLLATLLASVSILSLLAGLGTWLVGSPAPTWLDSRPVWIAGLLLVGGALVPIWWHLGFRVTAKSGQRRAHSTTTQLP